MATIEYHADALANDFVLFCDDVRRIQTWRDLFAHGPPVSALTYTPSEASLEGVFTASRNVLFANHGGIATGRLWMFLADGPWQDDTRIRDYWKIWRCLSRDGVVWPELQRGPEIAVRLPRRVRYATIALVDDAKVDAAMTIAFRSEFVSFMLISKDDLLSAAGTLELFGAAFPPLDDGSPDQYVNWGKLIQVRAALGDVIIKRAGLFNEFAWSVDLFARPDVLLPFVEQAVHRRA